MKWTAENPTEEGLYWFRRKPGEGVLMNVHFYECLQDGVRKHLSAEPMLPYDWTAKPGFVVSRMVGQWSRYE